MVPAHGGHVGSFIWYSRSGGIVTCRKVSLPRTYRPTHTHLSLDFFIYVYSSSLTIGQLRRRFAKSSRR